MEYAGEAYITAEAIVSANPISIWYGIGSISALATIIANGTRLGEEWNTSTAGSETWTTASAGSETWTTVSAGSESWSDVSVGSNTWTDTSSSSNTWLQQG